MKKPRAGGKVDDMAPLTVASGQDASGVAFWKAKRVRLELVGYYGAGKPLQLNGCAPSLHGKSLAIVSSVGA